MGWWWWQRANVNEKKHWYINSKGWRGRARQGRSLKQRQLAISRLVLAGSIKAAADPHACLGRLHLHCLHNNVVLIRLLTTVVKLTLPVRKLWLNATQEYTLLLIRDSAGLISVFTCYGVCLRLWQVTVLFVNVRNGICLALLAVSIKSSLGIFIHECGMGLRINRWNE